MSERPGPQSAELRHLFDLVENVDDLVQSVRPDGTFVYVNRAWRETLGYLPEDVEKLNVFEIIDPSSRAHCQEVLARVLAGESFSHVSTVFIAKDGQRIQLEGSVNCRFENGKPQATRSILRNVTAQRRFESQQAAEARVLQALGEGAPLDRVLTVLIEAIEESSDGLLGSVLLLDEENRLRHGAAPSLPESYNRAVDGIMIGPVAGSCGTAAFRKEPVIVSDIASDPLWETPRDLALSHGLRACWSTPILSGDRVLGTFALYYREPRSPGPDELQLTERMTQLARIAIERRRDEKALRDSQRMLAIVLNSIPQGVFWKDRNSVYLGCNSVVSGATGYDSPEEIVGRTDFDTNCFTPEQAAFYVEKDRSVLLKGVPEFGIIEQMTRADGSTVWLETNKAPLRDGDGRIVGVLGTWQDITERKRAEERLLESERKYRDLVETSHDLIWSVDVDGRWTFVNRHGAKSIYGYDPEEMVGRTFFEFLAPDCMERARDTHQRLLAGETTVRYEIDHVRKDGETVTLSFNAIPAYDCAGQLVGSTGTAVNVTERKRAEEARRKLEVQIQHAQKLESLGVLAGGIAHDFNNLLTSMLGYANLAQMQLAPGSPILPMLHEIERAAQRAAELTGQMLAYSGRGKFVIQLVDVASLVREMSKLLETVISKKARLKLDLQPATIEGDATQIRQIVMNLITNASDALGEAGGPVALRTGTRSASAESLRSAYINDDLPEGEYAFIEVADAGSGMDDATVRRIFDPFFTTKFMGRGLGLSAVLGIVRGHRGTIHVTSTPGAGTLFQVLIPAAAPKSSDSSGTISALSAWRGHGTILVADDEERIRVFAKRVLSDAGFQVLLAVDGQEALELFDRNASDVTAVLLDWTMPRLDGSQVVRRLRARSDVPILLTSGYSAPDVTSQLGGTLAFEFLQKPFQPSDLIGSVRRLLTK